MWPFGYTNSLSTVLCWQPKDWHPADCVSTRSPSPHGVLVCWRASRLNCPPLRFICSLLCCNCRPLCFNCLPATSARTRRECTGALPTTTGITPRCWASCACLRPSSGPSRRSGAATTSSTSGGLRVEISRGLVNWVETTLCHADIFACGHTADASVS